MRSHPNPGLLATPQLAGYLSSPRGHQTPPPDVGVSCARARDQLRRDRVQGARLPRRGGRVRRHAAAVDRALPCALSPHLHHVSRPRACGRASCRADGWVDPRLGPHTGDCVDTAASRLRAVARFSRHTHHQRGRVQVAGRPAGRRWGSRQRRRASARYQRRSVAGITVSPTRRSAGKKPARAASNARSATPTGAEGLCVVGPRASRGGSRSPRRGRRAR